MVRLIRVDTCNYKELHTSNVQMVFDISIIMGEPITVSQIGICTNLAHSDKSFDAFKGCLHSFISDVMDKCNQKVGISTS